MVLEFYNSKTRKKEIFLPINSSRITVYVCGPTVYDASHIGNARSAVVFDVFIRLLRHIYPCVVYVRNVTDIDDKINKKARDEAVDISTITHRYYNQYIHDMNALGVEPPDIEPHATVHIAEIISFIQRLLEKGHAYEAEGHVLFDITTDADYGSLSGRRLEDMKDGARITPESYKRNAGDFVLWKPSTKDLPGWASLWGRGRPGWHIECSAMIKKHLGETIDIHGGGEDLKFPHHENEAAQSRSIHEKPLANMWLHNGMLNMSGEKMSKSQGNIKLVKDVLNEYQGEAIRLALLQGHYRQNLDFTSELLKQSARNLDRIYGILRDMKDIEEAKDIEVFPEFMKALCDDLNTPKALSALFSFIKSSEMVDNPSRSKACLLGVGKLLGILQYSPDMWFQGSCSDNHGEIEKLIRQRSEARSAKDYTRSDMLRIQLMELNVSIEDNPDGTTRWRRR